MSTNMHPIIPLQPIASSLLSPSTELATTPINNYFSEEDKKKSNGNDVQVQEELLE
jgi:hypothetical protein